MTWRGEAPLRPDANVYPWHYWTMMLWSERRKIQTSADILLTTVPLNAGRIAWAWNDAARVIVVYDTEPGIAGQVTLDYGIGSVAVPLPNTGGAKTSVAVNWTIPALSLLIDLKARRTVGSGTSGLFVSSVMVEVLTYTCTSGGIHA